jgi:hypothetical protein
MAATVAAISREWEIEIVKRPHLRRFVVLPKRWVVERTFAWLNRCRRLAKDFENLTSNFPPPRLHPDHAKKALQSMMKFRDRLSRKFPAITCTEIRLDLPRPENVSYLLNHLSGVDGFLKELSSTQIE